MSCQIHLEVLLEILNLGFLNNKIKWFDWFIIFHFVMWYGSVESLHKKDTVKLVLKFTKSSVQTIFLVWLYVCLVQRLEVRVFWGEQTPGITCQKACKKYSRLFISAFKWITITISKKLWMILFQSDLECLCVYRRTVYFNLKICYTCQL